MMAPCIYIEHSHTRRPIQCTVKQSPSCFTVIQIELNGAARCERTTLPINSYGDQHLYIMHRNFPNFTYRAICSIQYSTSVEIFLYCHMLARFGNVLASVREVGCTAMGGDAFYPSPLSFFHLPSLSRIPYDCHRVVERHLGPSSLL